MPTVRPERTTKSLCLLPAEALFDGSMPMDKALERAVVLEERKAAEAQITTMINLTIDMVLAILRNIIVGERPLEFSAPSGLAMTISM